MIFEETPLGFEVITEHFIAFFGKHSSTLPFLQKKYPLLNWTWVKQVHGDHLEKSVDCDGRSREADAHWTDVNELALITRTADCVPLLAFNSKSNVVLSIHAGWKGVANRISPKSFEKLKEFHPLDSWTIMMGPHIAPESFEIKDDVRKKLENSTSLKAPEWLQESQGQMTAHLSKILVSQLEEIGIRKSQIHFLCLDTKLDLRFHSYRRDKELSGRQISFIALLGKN